MLFSAAKFQNLQQEPPKIAEAMPFYKTTDWCDCGFESAFVAERAAVCLLCSISDQINSNINGDLNNSGSVSAEMLQPPKTL